MSNKRRNDIVRTFLMVLFLILSSASRSQSAERFISQEPWEGIPDFYKEWIYPDFKFPSDSSEWKDDRLRIKDTLLTLLGKIPARPLSPKVRILFREKKNGYVLEKFEIDNGVDSWIPGYLAIPSNTKSKVPVIIGLHGHSSSKENIFGFESNTAQDVLALFISNGFAVMAIDSYFNGERRGKGPSGSNETGEKGPDQETSLFKINLWFGRSLWGMMLRDEQIALDYLVSRPEIDPGRIGVEGMSMGSTRAWWLAALDERIRVVSGIACFTRYKELIEQRQLGAHGIYYFVPGMLNHFDSEVVMGLIAPRPFLVLTGDSDAGSPVSGIKVLENKLQAVYSIYGKKENFRSIIYENTGHVFTDEMKIEMLKWFEKYLK